MIYNVSVLELLFNLLILRSLKLLTRSEAQVKEEGCVRFSAANVKLVLILNMTLIKWLFPLGLQLLKVDRFLYGTCYIETFAVMLFGCRRFYAFCMVSSPAFAYSYSHGQKKCCVSLVHTI